VAEGYTRGEERRGKSAHLLLIRIGEGSRGKVSPLKMALSDQARMVTAQEDISSKKKKEGKRKEERTKHPKPETRSARMGSDLLHPRKAPRESESIERTRSSTSKPLLAQNEPRPQKLRGSEVSLASTTGLIITPGGPGLSADRTKKVFK